MLVIKPLDRPLFMKSDNISFKKELKAQLQIPVNSR
jgi:hypothetical protein